MSDYFDEWYFLNQRIANEEQKYNEMKINYEKDFISLKYSDEFSKIKTLKEKEETAKLSLSDNKKELKDQEVKVNYLKDHREFLKMKIKMEMGSMESGLQE